MATSVDTDFFGTAYTFANPQTFSGGSSRTTQSGGSGGSNPLPTVQQYTPQVNQAINGGTPLQQFQAKMGQVAGTLKPNSFASNLWQDAMKKQQQDNLYPGVTPEMQDLRTNLGAWLAQNFNATPTPYGGNLSVDFNPLQGMASDAAMQGISKSMGYVQDASNTIHGMIGKGDNISAQVFPWLQQAFASAQAGGQAGTDWLNMGRAPLQELMANGGAPNIQNALQAIKEQGMIGINDQLAQIQEKYAQGGLGRGSDISGALATGASRGIADINAQQSTLEAQIMNAAADRRVSATGLVPQFANAAASNQYNMASTMGGLADSYLNSLVQPYQVQAGLASQLPGLASTTSGIYSNAANSLTSQAALDVNRQQGNIANQYNEFVRNTTPAYLNPALQFGTSYNPVPSQNNSGGGAWGALGQVGGSLMSALPFLMASSRTLKENIEPADAQAVTKKLRDLSIYKWNYKGDKTRHIGPIAEEFQEAFGVGDGLTLHPVDLFGVMLSAVKGMTETHA